MYEGSNAMQELVENGSLLKSTEESIKYLSDALHNLNEQLSQCTSLMPEMILKNRITVVKEQIDTLVKRRDELQKRKEEIYKQFQTAMTCASYEDTIDRIDRIVMKLLAIDDIYSETHKTSNVTIMEFVSGLLKEKARLTQTM